MPTLNAITDAMLIEAMRSATSRLVFIGPAVWPNIASEIADSWQRLGRVKVTVILDVDAEVCRFGYGSLEGLKIVQKAAADHGETVGNEKGVRICVVIADHRTFVFSPSPKLLEAPPGEETEAATSQPKINGIVLDSAPQALEEEVGASSDGVLKRTVGLDPVQPKILESIEKDLSVNPPKSFDLARAVNVYNARIQFVEFTVSGCRLSEHTSRLPNYLVHIVGENEELNQKITNSIKLLDDEDDLITNKVLSQTTIMKKRDVIAETFLVHVPGGTVMERERRKELEDEIKALKGQIEKFTKAVKVALLDRCVATANQLAEELLPNVMRDIPPQWRRYLGSSPRPEDVKFRIQDALLKSFGDPESKIKRMKADLVFKDVTYEMLHDPKFVKVISERFPDLKHIEKYTAAKERESSDQSELDL